MSFSARVIALRKQKGLTQQGLADASGIHVQQIKRYETGSAPPTAEALKKFAPALHASTDFLLFEEQRRLSTPTIANRRRRALHRGWPIPYEY